MIFISMVAPLIYAFIKFGFHAPITLVDNQNNHDILNPWHSEIFRLWIQCVGGDFNEIIYPNERSRGGRFSNSMRRFSDILNDLELRDLPLQGGPYTWRGGLNGRSMSRLDRFLVTAD